MMKKVALVTPKGNTFGKNEKMSSFLAGLESMESFRFLWTGPNLGLITIASLLPSEWECHYIDENYRSINYNEKFDIVFISAMTQQIMNAYEISKSFRANGALTIIGGIHATLMPEEALKYVDVVLSGEGEVLVPEFLNDYNNKNVKRVYCETSPGSYSFENTLLPRFDLLEGYNYPLITLQTTRGCPHDCFFCSASKIFGSKYRRKDNSSIIRELKVINEKFPNALILFADDNVFVLRKQSKDLLRQMRDMNLRWIAQTDISIAEDDELLKLMVQAGCQWVVIGFESVSYKSLYDLDKRNWKLKQLPKYEQSIEKIQSYGIGVYGTFIVGLDEDGSDIFESTANFIKKNMLYGSNITVPTPLPGTRLREQLDSEGRILDRDWSYHTFWDINIKPKQMNCEELEEGLLNIYRTISSDSHVTERLAYLKQMAKRKKAILKEGVSQ
ncbi:B12-binding domain-containing radical SAM protein [Pelosinus baikalensis]|uniref:B12-binding domain-containing radical SAM protein n=1 Tax=Pelosinus baikalensis TaxID=2892015 RepID=A0ABS8HTM1_9FIRM|nr:radical SAM protein [Pelosinus baikalensis]MCC5466520.1 B12-binding domain-containing radical SAM protein [Pelosinus baikalensis]